MIILAQLSPDMLRGYPLFIVSVAATLWLLNQGADFFARFRSKPQEPPNQEILLAHNMLKERVEKLETKLESMEENVLSAGEERGRRIHGRLNPIAENLAEMKGQMEAFTMAFQKNAEVLIALINKRHE